MQRETGEPWETYKQTWTGNQMHVSAGTENGTQNSLVQREGKNTTLFKAKKN